MTEDGWIVAHTQPHRERWASENVWRQGCEFYLPMFARLVRGRLNETRAVYLFPSYIFVRPPNGQWHFLIGTWGIESVIMMGEQPARLTGGEISRLKALEGPDGLIAVPKRRELTKHHSRFVFGQMVRIKSGMFSGYIGIHQGSTGNERVRVLMDFLGRKTSVLIGDKLLEAA